MRETKPNFLVVGAGKAGTTSLYSYLQQVNGIFLPAVKEPHYFVSDEVRQRIPNTVTDRAEYLALYEPGERHHWRGDMSVTYLYYYEQAIPRILAELGSETRIGILLRNPVERAYSAYLDVYRHNPDEQATFAEALDLEMERLENPSLTPMIYYRDMSLYADGVTAYLDNFPNVKVMLTDDLRNEPFNTVSGFVEFLGQIQMPANLETEFRNIGGRTWRNPRVGTWIKGSVTRRIRDLAQRYAPTSYSWLKERLFRAMMDTAEPIPDTVRHDLIESFAPDVERLSKMLGRNLDAWLR